jgi:hypothetical protein
MRESHLQLAHNENTLYPDKCFMLILPWIESIVPLRPFALEIKVPRKPKTLK